MLLKKKSFDQIVGAFTKPIAELQAYVQAKTDEADKHRAAETQALAAADTHDQLASIAREEAARAAAFKDKLEAFINS